MNRGLWLWLFAAGACVKGGKQEQQGNEGKARGEAKAEAPETGGVATQTRDDGPPVPGGQIVVHLEVEPPHLGYFVNPDAWTRRLTIPLVYDTLVHEDPKTYEYTPALAASWEVSPDSLTYTFHLRGGVKWHDGHAFSAKDVKFTFDKMYDPSVRAQSMRANYEPFCDRWEAPDDATFVLYCHKPSFLMLTNLADLPIMPQHVFSTGDMNKHEALRKPVGTGPYRLESWTPRQSIVLARNDAYYGKKGYLDRIVYQFVEDPSVAVQLARKGELDFLSRVREAQWMGMKGDATIDASFNKVTDWPVSYSYMVFNLERPLFRDKRVRQAMAHLFDRRRILDTIMYGQGRMTESPFYFKAKNFHQNLAPRLYDPDRARRLLDEAGWKDSDGDGVRDREGVKLAFTFMRTIGSSTQEKWSTLLQEDLRKAGVTMEISPIEWSQFLERLRKHNFDLASLMGIFPSPRVEFFVNYHSSQIADGQNYSSYRNAEVDGLLDRIRGELDEAKRNGMELRLQEIIHEDAPEMFMYNHATNAIVHKRYRGVYTSPMWYQLGEWWIPRKPPGEGR